MEFLKSIWAWLDGNKTLIGAVILLFVNEPGDLFGMPLAEMFFGWLGNVLVGGGLVHKVIKGTKNTGK